MNQIHSADIQAYEKETKRKMRNEDLTFTQHAAIRAQQRGIPQIVVKLLYGYGKRDHHKDGLVYTLDKRALCRLERVLDNRQFQEVAKYSGCYIVVSRDYKIITVGYRKMRFKRNQKKR